MSFLDWNNSFSVGITDIDEQHKKLIELINISHDAMMCGKEDNVMESVLSNLAEYTVYHFTFEEDLMAETGYPQLEQHKIEHEKLKSKLSEIKAENSMSLISSNMRVMAFLQDWLIAHIMASDMHLGEYLSLKSQAGGSQRRAA